MNAALDELKIADVCHVGDGAHASIKRQEDGVLYLSSRNFKEGKLDLSKVYFISEEDYQKHFKPNSKAITKPEPGDIVLSIIGSIGEPYVVKSKDRFGLSSAVAILRPSDNDEVSSDYLYYWIKSPEFQQAIYAIKGGVAQGYVSLEMIRSLPVRKFTKPTQVKIVEILSAYDNLIENNNRRIAILEEMAQSLYREWFVNFRFPGHENAKFIDSPLGKIPEGWGVKKLSDVAEVNPESITKRNAPKSILYIDIASVGTNSIGEVKELNFSEAPSRARRIVRENDIIWATVRPNRKQYAFIAKPAENTIVSTGFAVLSAKTVPASLLFQMVTTDQFCSYLVNHASGAAYPAVNGGDFEKADLLIPEIGLCERFDSIAAPIMFEIDCLKKKNNVLNEQRDLLLPKLISGIIEV